MEIERQTEKEKVGVRDRETEIGVEGVENGETDRDRGGGSGDRETDRYWGEGSGDKETDRDRGWKIERLIDRDRGGGSGR